MWIQRRLFYCVFGELEEEESPVPLLTVKEYLLKDQDSAVHPNSKRYKQDWSPRCNGLTEAFFNSFQENFLDSTMAKYKNSEVT